MVKLDIHKTVKYLYYDDDELFLEYDWSTKGI